MRLLFKIMCFVLVACFGVRPCGATGQRSGSLPADTVARASGIADGEQYGWEQFVDDFMQYAASATEDVEGDESFKPDLLEDLEEMHRNPINLNAATRDELSTLPFLSSEQIDSLLSYRDRNQGGFRSLGELLTVRQLSYLDRAWMSLFVTFGDRQHPAEGTNGTSSDGYRRKRGEAFRGNPWWEGTHEWTATLDAPLYRRAGFYDYDADNYVTRMFTGQRIAHTLRYRYNWHQRVKYGATVQQDVGERWGTYGARPWDFGALYFYYKSAPQRRGRSSFSRYVITAGDYRVSLGQGLVMGSSSWQQSGQYLTGFRAETTALRPHTGTDESRFLRGVAGTVCLDRQGQWSLTAFASWHQLDGSVSEADKSNDHDPQTTDVITAWKTDGLHRTLQEISKRRVAQQLIGGGRIGWRSEYVNVGVNAIALHYDKEYQPPQRSYNRNYMRGRDAAAFSTDYTLHFRRWSLQGELATDRNGGFASTAVLRWTPVRKVTFAVQHRAFGHDFVSPYGQTCQAGSQLQNEQGVMAGMRYRPNGQIELKAWADYALHQRAVYLADTTSHRFEAAVELVFRGSPRWMHTFRYKIKGREQNVSGYKDVLGADQALLAWRSTQHLYWKSTWTGHACSVTVGADGCCYHSLGTSIDKELNVVAGSSFGGLLYSRFTYKLKQRLTASGMVTAFVTGDYTSRCYAYMPQLRGAVSIPSFYGRGTAGVLQVEGRLWRQLYLSVRLQSVKYFDRETISSGVNAIKSSVKNDLALQVRYRF